MTQVQGQGAGRKQRTHGLLMGYALWILGFFGAHRFYYGRRVSGTIWFFTLGLFGIGWLLDLFLMPWLARDASRTYRDGPYRYDLGWLLLTYGGIFGLHRFYLGKVGTGLLYLLTGGLLGAGVLYDYLSFNEQVSIANGQWRD